MICAIILSISNRLKLTIEEPDDSETGRLLRDLHKEYNDPNSKNKLELLSAYLRILLIELELENSKLKSRGKPLKDENEYGIFQKFLSIIEHDIGKTHKVADYSRRMGITTRKLSDICLHYSKKSAKELINQRLVSESKRLLQYTSCPVKEIALLLGFSDQYQFSKFFKKHAKVSPVHYRSRFK